MKKELNNRDFERINVLNYNIVGVLYVGNDEFEFQLDNISESGILFHFIKPVEMNILYQKILCCNDLYISFVDSPFVFSSDVFYVRHFMLNDVNYMAVKFKDIHVNYDSIYNYVGQLKAYESIITKVSRKIYLTATLK